MLERFKYTNNSGDTLEFGKDCLFVNENDLRDFVWEISTRNNRISGFKKGVVEKTIPLILKCDTEADGIYWRNRIFEVFEKDVLANKHGKIHIGDYYLRCFIVGSKKTEYLIHKGYMVISLVVKTDLPDWVKETTTNHSMYYPEEQNYLEYPYDFPHDFALPIAGDTLNNTAFAPSNFILTIEGEVLSPTLFIGGHEYTVYVNVDEGEYLTIDSVNKTIVLTKNDGQKINCFNERNKKSYIFEKIPVGNSTITSTIKDLKFTITLLDERSEPLWT